MNCRCQDNRDRIADLITGILSEKHAQQLHEHVAVCSSCREYVSSLQSQDECLKTFFDALDADMPARQHKVVEAIDAVNVPSGWAIRAVLARIADSSVSSRAAAAVVIAVVTLYFIVTMTWISQITEYMKMGTECIRLSSGV